MEKEGADEKLAAEMKADKAGLAPPVMGYAMKSQMVDQYSMISNLSFVRPFEVDSTMAMDLSNTTYKAFLNWGVFAD